MEEHCHGLFSNFYRELMSMSQLRASSAKVCWRLCSLCFFNGAPFEKEKQEKQASQDPISVAKQICCFLGWLSGFETNPISITAVMSIPSSFWMAEPEEFEDVN